MSECEHTAEDRGEETGLLVRIASVDLLPVSEIVAHGELEFLDSPIEKVDGQLLTPPSSLIGDRPNSIANVSTGVEPAEP